MASPLFARPSIAAGEKEPFSTPHTVTVLLVGLSLLLYALSSHDTETSAVANTKRGVAAALLIGIIFSAEHLRDTLFVRPHPAIWRAVTGCGLFYCMACAFALFQRLETLQDIMQALDPVHATGPRGTALPETSYGEHCEFTPSNVWSQVDIFVAAHFIGWIFKASMFRDFWLAMLLSLLFELMEYTFEFLQPNFAECWWDHWLLDFLICNTGGILVGHMLMSYFNSRQYSWAGPGAGAAAAAAVAGGGEPSRRSISSAGKALAVRVLKQFRPVSALVEYEWRVGGSIKRLLYVTAMVVIVLVSELDAFFLKFILRVQPPSGLNLYRLILWWAVGMVALRDYYAFMTDNRIKRLGATCWVSLAMALLELLVVLKFGPQLPEWQDKRPPNAIVWAWGVTITISVGFAVWWYGWELPARLRAAALSPTAQGSGVDDEGAAAETAGASDGTAQRKRASSSRPSATRLSRRN